jgi:hypothetical protein
MQVCEWKVFADFRDLEVIDLERKLGNVPCVCDDNVVEGGVLFAKAGESDS